MSIIKKALNIIPTAVASRAFGAIADFEFLPPVQKTINRAFAHLAHLNMDESSAQPDDFPSLNKLFTRQLRDGVRTIHTDQLISPVDGKLSFAGQIHDGIMIQAKGQEYSAMELANPDQSQDFSWIKNAYAFTIYLSPSNYHRIHAPVSGTITHISYAPGRLLPVNRIGYWLTDDLLPANERLTSFISQKDGHRCALVKIGATCVGKISLTFDTFATNQSLLKSPFFKPISEPHNIQAGDEIARFELGSTVVLFVDHDSFVPQPNLKPGQKIQLGDPLGNWQF